MHSHCTFSLTHSNQRTYNSSHLSTSAVHLYHSEDVIVSSLVLDRKLGSAGQQIIQML